MRKRGDDLFDHPVGEIFLFRVAAHVLERQYRYRRLVGQREPRRRRPRRWQLNGALGTLCARSEQVAAPWQGAQKSLLMIIEDPPNLADALGNAVVGNEQAWPDGLHDFVAIDQATRILDEEAQQGERLRS